MNKTERGLIAAVIIDLENQRRRIDATIERLRSMLAMPEPVVRPANGRWTEDDDATLARLIGDEGMTHSEAATMLGRTPLAVSQRMTRLGLTRPGRAAPE